MRQYCTAFLTTLTALPCGPACAQDAATCLAGAVDAARWIDSHTIETEHGVTWGADPEDTGALTDNLYSGSAGVVLFFAELWLATGDDRWRSLATRGADNLIANLPDALALDGRGDAGLYTGVAGIGFVLDQVFRATRERAYRDGAHKCVQLIHDSAIGDEAGVTWGPVTDIIAGDAGTGLFLLYASGSMGHEASLDLAARAGRSLLRRADEADGGLSWRMTPDFARIMPNFSHGTAGVAFFLARLHEATGEGVFLDGAARGAAHVRTIADTSDDGFLLHHHHPGGEDLYYLGWCHGPVGTSRLFEALQRVSAQPEWAALQMGCARAISASGAPEGRTAGYWDNVGRCCGTAGLGDFFLSRYEKTANPKYLAMALRCAHEALSRASRTDTGLKWVHAEHRVRPDFRVAQTGLAQGAAGIGLMLLHADAVLKGREWALRLADEVP